MCINRFVVSTYISQLNNQIKHIDSLMTIGICKIYNFGMLKVNILQS